MKRTLPHIGILGDVMLDRFVDGHVDRLSPEAPVPILTVDRQIAVPGGAANVAVNCSTLGAEVSVFGLIGQDAEGDDLRALLAAHSISSQLDVTEAPTILKTRMIDRGRHLFRVDREQRFPPTAAITLRNRFIAALPTFRMALLSDYAKGTLHDPQPVISAARACGLRVCVDPKMSPFDQFAGADVMTPNEAEFEAATGFRTDSAEFPEAAEQMAARLQLKALIVTAGVRGMYVTQVGAATAHIPAHRVRAVDVTGAGDVVLSALACALVQGLTIEQAAHQANRAAALSVEQPGTGVVSAALVANSRSQDA